MDFETLFGIIYGSILLVIFIVFAVLLLIQCIRSTRRRDNYLEQLTQHERDVIFTYIRLGNTWAKKVNNDEYF